MVNVKQLKQDLEHAPSWVCSSFEDLDDITWTWQQMYKALINAHAPFRAVKVTRNSLPWVDRSIRKEMNKSFKLLKRCKGSLDTVDYWLKYKAQRNRVNTLLRKAEAMEG